MIAKKEYTSLLVFISVFIAYYFSTSLAYGTIPEQVKFIAQNTSSFLLTMVATVFLITLFWAFLLLMRLLYKRVGAILNSPFIALAYFLSFFLLFAQFLKWSEYQYCVKIHSVEYMDKFGFNVLRECSPGINKYVFVGLMIVLALFFANLDRIIPSKKLKNYYKKLLN